MSRKKRFLLLVGSFTLLLLASYWLGFSKTLEVRKNYMRAKKGQNLSKNIPKQIQLLSKKQLYYDSILTKRQLNTSSIENGLLRVLSQKVTVNNLKIKEFKTPHTVTDSTTNYVTMNFILEGNFNDLLKTVYTLEMNGSFGEIIHLHFQKEMDFKTKRKYLTVKVLLQSIQ